MDAYQIVQRPLLTEKSDRLREGSRQYCFQVAPSANKLEIKQAVEELFKVKVDKVRVYNLEGKKKRMGRHEGRRADWKKAFVTLKGESVIDLFEGV